MHILLLLSIIQAEMSVLRNRLTMVESKNSLLEQEKEDLEGTVTMLKNNVKPEPGKDPTMNPIFTNNNGLTFYAINIFFTMIKFKVVLSGLKTKNVSFAPDTTDPDSDSEFESESTNCAQSTYGKSACVYLHVL